VNAMAVAAQFAGAQVVGHDQQDVHALLGGGGDGAEQQGKEEHECASGHGFPFRASRI